MVLPHDIQLDLLLELAPNIERIFVPYNPDVSFEIYNLGRAQEAAADLGVELVLGEAYNDDEVAELLATSFPADIDAIWITSSRESTFPRDGDNFIPFALDHDLPLVVSTASFVPDGALFAYAVDLVELVAQGIRLVDKVLKGTPTAALPIERPEYILTINLQTAQAIGLEIPDDVLEKAHEIIR